MSWAFDIPSQFPGQARDWTGKVQYYAAKTQEAVAAASEAVWSDTKALLDPAKKAQVQLEQTAENVLQQGIDTAYGAVGRATSAIASGLGGVVAPISSGIKWGIILALALVTVYFLNFIPRPNR